MTVKRWNTAPALRFRKYYLLEQIYRTPARSLRMQHRAQRQAFLSPVARLSLEGQDLLIIKASRPHPDTPHLVGLLWARDRSVAEKTDKTQHSHKTDIHVPRGIRTRIPSKQAAAHPRLRPRGHWDRPSMSILLHDLQVYLLKRMRKKPGLIRNKKYSIIRQ